MRVSLPYSADNRHPHHIAEVIETSTTGFLAQCLEPDELNFPAMPPFGSWVTAIDDDTGNRIFAVVSYVTTTPIDSIHRARALGLSLSELREQQPQIFAMLKTEFQAAILGFETSENRAQHQSRRTFHYLPPRPPQIHQAVFRGDRQEIIRFTDSPDFLRILLQVTDAPVDALIAAVLREAYVMRQGDRHWLVEIGRNLSLWLKDDYDRLRYVLSQIHF
ncbi:MAG: hypothetical protein RLZZ568_1369 [Cyanobacteriota bacterium]|jgi:hypothetical protein